MKKIGVKGILIAISVTLILVVNGAIGGVLMFADGVGEDAVIALSKNTDNLVYALIFGLIVTVIGGYLSARFSHNTPYLNSGVFGVIGVVIGLFLATYDPLWFDIVASLAVIPTALFDGHVFMLNHRKTIA